jgi:hypothetical protein
MSTHPIPLHGAATAARRGPRPQLTTRVAVLLARHRLDHDLAAGTAPACTPAHALRADQLAAARTREELATALDSVVVTAQRPPAALSAAAPLRRRAIRDERAALEQLARRLRDPRPVRARGVALTRDLLTDGAGPLYAGAPAGVIGHAARRALHHLEH